MYIVTATLFDKKNCGTELISVNKFESIAKIQAKYYVEQLSKKGKGLVVKENKNTSNYSEGGYTVFKKTTPVAVCSILFVPEEEYKYF